MSRQTTTEILEELKTEIERRFNVSARIRLWRGPNEDVELESAPAFYLEPGTLTVERINTASPRAQQTVRFLSEYKTTYEEIDASLRAEMLFFERVSRDLMKSPRLSCGAFILRTTTFNDAPSGYSVSTVENGYSSIYGGIEISVAIE